MGWGTEKGGEVPMCYTNAPGTVSKQVRCPHHSKSKYWRFIVCSSTLNGRRRNNLHEDCLRQDGFNSPREVRSYSSTYVLVALLYPMEERMSCQNVAAVSCFCSVPVSKALTDSPGQALI